MPINNSYDEAAIVEAIATALDNFYTNLIKKSRQPKCKNCHETQKSVSVPSQGYEWGGSDY